LQRDHPDVLARLEAGEFKSTRGAAISAGIIRGPVYVHNDPYRAAADLADKFAPDELHTLVSVLTKILVNPGDPTNALPDGYRTVTAAEAARRLGITPNSVRERLRRGTLPGTRSGRRWVVFLPPELDAH
jgi:excisionase family DNA binding protein